MNRILRAIDRNVLIAMTEKAYFFSVPIVLENGDEIYFDCEVKKDSPTVMTYKSSKAPKFITLDLTADCNSPSGTSHSSPQNAPSLLQ